MLLQGNKAQGTKNRQIYLSSLSTVFRYTWIALAYYPVLYDRCLTFRRRSKNGPTSCEFGVFEFRLLFGLYTVYSEELCPQLDVWYFSMGKDYVCVKMQQLDPGFSGSKQVSVKVIIKLCVRQISWLCQGRGGGVMWGLWKPKLSPIDVLLVSWVKIDLKSQWHLC